MDDYAHSFDVDGGPSKWQPLADHLAAVANLAAMRAARPLKERGRSMSRLSDRSLFSADIAQEDARTVIARMP